MVTMAKLSQAYRSRARRAATVPQKMIGQEARLVHAGVREGVDVELYARTPLPVTGKMRASVQIRFLGPGFAIVYAAAVAPYAPIRAKATGLSASGGHLLNMDPAAYMRARYGPALLALKRRNLRAIHGAGATSINGR